MQTQRHTYAIHCPVCGTTFRVTGLVEAMEHYGPNTYKCQCGDWRYLIYDITADMPVGFAMDAEALYVAAKLLTATR